MILILFSSVSFWVSLLVSCAGGALVLWGLWIEDVADKHKLPEEYEGLFDDVVKQQKRKGRRGWRILMVGIAIELFAAMIATYETAVLTLETAKASERAAEANLLAKGFEKQIEELRKENFVLKIKLRPLALNEANRSNLLQCLSGIRPKVKISIFFDDTRTSPSFAIGLDIKSILEQTDFGGDFFDSARSQAYSLPDDGIIFVVLDPSNIPRHITEITNCFHKVDLPTMIRGRPTTPDLIWPLDSSNAFIVINPK